MSQTPVAPLMEGPRRLSADERWELAASAEASARANRPRLLALLGGVVLGVSLLMLLWAALDLRGASSGLERAEARLDRVVGKASELTRLRVLSENGGGDEGLVGAPIPDFLSRMQRVARRAELADDIGLPRPREAPIGRGVDVVSYPYTVNDYSLPKLMEFVRLALVEFDGLRVNKLTLRPRRDRWQMQVEFERWERTGG